MDWTGVVDWNTELLERNSGILEWNTGLPTACEPTGAYTCRAAQQLEIKTAARELTVKSSSSFVERWPQEQRRIPSF